MLSRKLLNFTVLLCILTAGCTPTESPPEAGPEDVLQRYLNAVIECRFEDAYTCTSSVDKAVKNLQAYLAERSDENSFVTRILSRTASFSVKKVTRMGDKAICMTEVIMPDFEIIFGEILGKSLIEDLTGNSMEDLARVRRRISHFEGKYRKKGVPGKKTVETFILIREKDGWRVFHNWGSNNSEGIPQRGDDAR